MAKVNTELNTANVDPRTLFANPWNSNHLDSKAESQLRSSIERYGMIDHTHVRELSGGRLEVLGGQHRVEECIRQGYPTIPIINHGTVSESKAREISLVLNGRYGTDDPIELLEVVEYIQKNDDVDLSEFLPYDEMSVEAALASKKIDLDDVFPDETDDFEGDDLGIDEPSQSKADARINMKFSLSRDDADQVQKTIDGLIKKHNLRERHPAVNAGDALAIALLGQQ